MLGPVNPIKAGEPLRGASNSVKSQAKETFLQLKMFALGRAEYEGKTLGHKIGKPKEGSEGQRLSQKTGQVVGLGQEDRPFILRTNKDLQPVRDKLRDAIRAGDQNAALSIADKLGKGLLLIKGYKNREDIPRFFRELAGKVKHQEIKEGDLPFMLNHIKASYSEFAKDVEGWNKKQS